MRSQSTTLLLVSALFVAASLRVDIDAEQQSGAACAMRTVTDGTLCGVSNVISRVTDALKCGTRRVCVKWVGCHNVPKICSTTSTSPKTCEVIDSCPVTLAAQLAGTGTIDNMEDITIA